MRVQRHPRARRRDERRMERGPQPVSAAGRSDPELGQCRQGLCGPRETDAGGRDPGPLAGRRHQGDAGADQGPRGVQEIQAAQEDLSTALARLMVVVEKYPDLKANENFRDLQSQLEGTENRITVARKRYIDKVAEYNKLVRFFPTNMTAKYILKMDVKPNFTVADEKAAAQPPEVKF